MSRAYRIKVSESLTRVIKGSDHIRTQLEILNVLPADEMCALLEEELRSRGFEERDGKYVRRHEDGIEVEIDPIDSSVTVQISGEEEVTVKATRTGWSYDREGENAKKAKSSLQGQLSKDLESDVDAKEEALQSELTNKLEQALGDIRQELDQVANRVTSAALKRKASQLGQIKEVSEDQETGSMTIVVEV